MSDSIQLSSEKCVLESGKRKQKHTLIINNDADSCEHDSSACPPKKSRGSSSASIENTSSTNATPDTTMTIGLMSVVNSSEPGTEVQLSSTTDNNRGDNETCSICLAEISKQEIGCPDGCHHIFCLTCLSNWAKKSNECPLDRQPFSLILVMKDKEHRKLVQILRPPALVDEPSADSDLELQELDDSVELEFEFNCETCRWPITEDELLVCDYCCREFHLRCYDPSWKHVPQGENIEWYCRHCTRNEASSCSVM